MVRFKIRVTDTQAVVSERQGPLTTGMVGAMARFSFDSVWEGLTRVAVFRCGCVTRDVLQWDGDTVKIPAEVLREPGDLFAGVEGRNSDGSTVIPTVWVRCGTVRLGANASGDPSTDPGLTVWQQIQEAMGDPAKLQTADKSSLVAAINEVLAAINEVLAGSGGAVDEAAVERIVEAYLREHPSEGGTVDEETVARLVEAYLREHPPVAELETDTSLSVKGAAADAYVTGNSIRTVGRRVLKVEAEVQEAGRRIPVKIDLIDPEQFQEKMFLQATVGTSTIADKAASSSNNIHGIYPVEDGTKVHVYTVSKEHYAEVSVGKLLYDTDGVLRSYAVGKDPVVCSVEGYTIGYLGIVAGSARGTLAAIQELTEDYTDEYIRRGIAGYAVQLDEYNDDLAHKKLEALEAASAAVEGRLAALGKKVIPNYAEFSVFDRFGTITDSLGVGTYRQSDGTDVNDADKAWGAHIAKNCHNVWLSLGFGGATTSNWIEGVSWTDNGLTKALRPENECGAYIIALGYNDNNTSSSSGGVPLGSMADIDGEDHDNNAVSYYGNMDKILRKLHGAFPAAKLFVLNNPYYNTELAASYNTALAEVTERLAGSNVHLIDLYGRYHEIYSELAADREGNHYHPQVYQYMGMLIATAISDYMRDAYEEFKYLSRQAVADDTGNFIPAPATAQVGQTIVVKEVDGDGKPVSWECADLAGGDGHKWEHILDYTTTEQIDAVGIEITENSEGVPLSELKYNEIWVMTKMVGVDTNTHNWWGCWCYPHVTQGGGEEFKAMGASSGGTTGTRYVSYYHFIRGGKMYYTDGSKTFVYTIGGGKDAWLDNYLDYHLFDYFEKVVIVADSTRVIGADTEIRVLGRRA